MTCVRTVAWMAATLALGAGCSASKSTYTSMAGNYRVDMPGTPKELSQNQGTPVGVLAMHVATSADSKDIAYSVMYADYPASIIRPETVGGVLDGVAGGFIQGSGFQELGRKSSTLYGHHGSELSFSAKSASGAPGKGRSRIVLVGNRLFQIIIVGPEAEMTDAIASEFFASFQLLDASPAAGKAGPAPGISNMPTTVATTGKPAREIAGWGPYFDPMGDCTTQVEDGILTITVPGKLHDFTPPPDGQFDAPRILRDVSGDFTAEVEVPDVLHPSDTSTRPGGAPYNGLGLLVMVDNANYLRLEKASVNRGGVINAYGLFNGRDQGRSFGQDGEMPADTRFLRIQRRGGALLTYSSIDGQAWIPQPVWNVSWPASAKVGIIAVSSADQPFAARFQGLKITTP